MPPALPGFYYDTEKQKYFRIQPNHLAANGSAIKYSKAALEKEAKDQCEQKRRRVQQQKERQTRLQRSRVLESPLGGAWSLMRELGVRTSESGFVWRAWAQGLQRSNVLKFPPRDGGGGIFVFDEATGVLTHSEAGEGNGFSWLCVDTCLDSVNLKGVMLMMGVPAEDIRWLQLAIWGPRVGFQWVVCLILSSLILRSVGIRIMR